MGFFESGSCQYGIKGQRRRFRDFPVRTHRAAAGWMESELLSENTLNKAEKEGGKGGEGGRERQLEQETGKRDL